jgi:hypothetical protein
MTTRGLHATPSRVHAVWTLQEEGHLTAKIGDSTLGHVVMVADGSFIAFDGQSTPLGRHQTLRAAQLSTLRAAEGSGAPTLDRLSPVLALVAGAVAAGLLTVGVVVLSVAP